MEEINFALDTFYAVMAGALVMFMAAGFTMLEAGLVQKKDVSEIVTKNIGLYSIACIMYLVCGFILMYPGGALIEGIIPSIGTSLGLSTSLPMANWYGLSSFDADEDIGKKMLLLIPIKQTSFSKLCLLLQRCLLFQVPLLEE